MAKRTFKGFLQEYCRELSGVSTLSQRKLAVLAGESAPRLAEPLFLLAVENGTIEHLCSLCSGMWMEREYAELAKEAGGYCGNARAFAALNHVPARYRAVGQAFEAQWDVLNSERRMSGLLRVRIRDLLDAAGVSAYRLLLDAGVNKGNGYAYLTHGDTSKVSYATARKMYEQAKTYSLSASLDNG